MKQIYTVDEWKIIEDGFSAENHQMSESIFSIGNGRIGQRANFEETYSGESLQGSYIAGIYYPDKTKVGWWKNGYPEYFAKVLNSPNWIGIKVNINNIELDFAKCKIESFRRELDMKEGVLRRSAVAELSNGNKIELNSERFVSIVDSYAGAIKYSVKALNFEGEISFTPYLDGDIENEDSNYDEKFWDEISTNAEKGKAVLITKTKKTEFAVATGMKFCVNIDGETLPNLEITPAEREKYVENSFSLSVKKGQTATIVKYCVTLSSLDFETEELEEKCNNKLEWLKCKSFEHMLNEQKNAWAQKWEHSDIKIEGDASAQQGIRFNIFQLNQTYTGEDERLNIGPKGFTGEKYGGSTYWDTEAFCFPFYLSTADQSVSRQLLMYRYKQLQKAIENAEKLGFSGGAALYPMVTMTGEECHNEWEITFEEIHRNGAIAFAIYDYVRYSDDFDYVKDFGIDVLIGISRFWQQRFNFSEQKNRFVMLGVTGPNEYENNVNNNWYTNIMAQWTLQYTCECLKTIVRTDPQAFSEIQKRNNLQADAEIPAWSDLAANIYFAFDASKGIFLQQDGFLDKELITVDQLPEDQRPINQNWSWDRILRSCFIKQADVVQGLYAFEDKFDFDTIKRNFDFYEPMTVHESSLSPCIHSVVASKLKYHEKAYEMYLRTARLDLDDYNNEAHEGCHITSMAGTWLAITKGFAGMRIKNNMLFFDPIIPESWTSYSFKIGFRSIWLNITVAKEGTTIQNNSDKAIKVNIKDSVSEIKGGESVTI